MKRLMRWLGYRTPEELDQEMIDRLVAGCARRKRAIRQDITISGAINAKWRITIERIA